MNALIRSTLVAAVAVVAAAGCAKETSTAIPTGTDLKGTWAQNGFGYEMGKPVTWKDQTLVIEKAEVPGSPASGEYNREGSGPQKGGHQRRRRRRRRHPHRRRGRILRGSIGGGEDPGPVRRDG